MVIARVAIKIKCKEHRPETSNDLSLTSARPTLQRGYELERLNWAVHAGMACELCHAAVNCECWWTVGPPTGVAHVAGPRRRPQRGLGCSVWPCGPGRHVEPTKRTGHVSASNNTLSENLDDHCLKCGDCSDRVVRDRLGRLCLAIA